MPLTSIRPVNCGTHIGGLVPLIGDQIYRHLKNTPGEYHDVFSHPEKMFSMGLITTSTFRRITNDIPVAFDKTKDYFIDFAFKNSLWDMIPLDTPFSMDRWVIIRDHHNMSNNEMIRFANTWVTFNLSPEKSKELIEDLLVLWKRRKWNTVANKKQIILTAQSFGVIGKKYSDMFQKEFDDEERKTKFKPSPPSMSEDLHFSERIRDLSIFLKSLGTTVKDVPSISSSSTSGGYVSESDRKYDLFDGGSTGYGSYDCGSDDDTLSPLDEDDDDRLMFVMETEKTM